MKTALVLAGGGSRGAYQIGVWQALREMDIPIHIVTGTSVGALNGALIAQNSFDTAFPVFLILVIAVAISSTGNNGTSIACILV